MEELEPQRSTESRGFADEMLQWRWVTHGVIPSIRKTGSYSLDTSDSNTAVQVKDMFSQITEALQEIKSSCALDTEWKNKIERYCTKIGVMTKDVKASVGFIN